MINKIKHPQILKHLTSLKLRKLILEDHKTIENWNDEEKLTGNDRDRLGYKEARLQSLLAQALRRESYEVIIESYFSKKLRGKGTKSCDLYAYDSSGDKSFWIEIKSISLKDGARHIISSCFYDIAKMLAHREKEDNIIIWVAFYSENLQSYKNIFLDDALENKNPLTSIKQSDLRSAFPIKKRGRISNPKDKISGLIKNTKPGNAIEALIWLQDWVRDQGGASVIIPISSLKGPIKKEWVKYGGFCGIL